MGASAAGGRHEGAVAIITGASRGIGLGIARRLVDEGAKVVITARKPEALAAAVDELGGPANALGVAGNAADESHQDEVIAKARETFGGLHLLVNNTGINPAYGPMLDSDLDIARKVLDVNVVAAFSWIKKAVASGLGDESHPGAVVNLASVAGQGASGVIGWYGVSKAALIHLTTELGYELGPDVRVNAVAPAVVKTKFAEALYEGREEKVVRAYPMKRLGLPEDVAGAVSFLLSADASWVTGQTLTVDGGVTLGGSL
ncbi:SDR family oxidoreductase [Terrabacter carboxydivorans]|uniref:SDR family oxidoreductase n=1 Tax=Terrabacter carboxydivorans TaxID=619730 RepID=A0ABN3LNK7_9MICO